jgi:hypothetical protein
MLGRRRNEASDALRAEIVDEVATAGRMQRREFLAAAAASGIATAASVAAPGAAFARAAGAPSDVFSGDPTVNPAWPFASDGLLYNYLEGTVLETSRSSIRVLVSNPDVFDVSVRVRRGTEIFCRGDLAAPLSAVQDGDRVELGTRFARQGVRVANWIVVNGLTGWSYIEAVDSASVTLSASSIHKADRQGSPVDIAVTPGTLTVAGDGVKRYGTTEGLAVGDGTTWTATADVAGNRPSNVWAIVINVVEPHSS